MKRSLRLRLMIAAIVSVTVALIAFGLFLTFLFRAYFADRVNAELDSYLVQLAASVSIDANGDLQVAELTDPRFLEPLSGYYWQVQSPDLPVIQSPSFWISPFSSDVPTKRGEKTFGSAVSETGERFLTGSWLVTLNANGSDTEVMLTIAVDRREFDESVAAFAVSLAIALSILGSFLVAASAIQVRIGLNPLENLRNDVNEIRGNSGSRLSDSYPSEVSPLIDEVNELLQHQEEAVENARQRASNLAHGLKTPLTILTALSQQSEKAGQPEIASEINAQVDNMRFFVERELARTRDQHSVDEWCRAAPVVEKIVSALRRSADAADLRWVTDVAEDSICPFDEYSLTELLGNLIDNAKKWTTDEIRVVVRGTREAGHISVSDNGPGIPPESLSNVTERGRKLDQLKPGQGLGLSIVEDMAQARGAHFELRNRQDGGLTGTVSWERGQSCRPA